MKNSFLVIWHGLVNAWEDLLNLALINALWFFLTLLVVTAPPATAGLYYATNQLVHREDFSWRTFFVGFRKYFRVSWRWALMNLVVLAVFITNIIFYGQQPNQWAAVLQVFFIVLAVIWLAINMYTFPLLLEQEKLSLRMALRNSLVLLARRPLASLLLILISAILITAGLFLQLFLVMLTFSWMAFLQNFLVVELVGELLEEQNKTNASGPQIEQVENLSASESGTDPVAENKDDPE